MLYDFSEKFHTFDYSEPLFADVICIRSFSDLISGKLDVAWSGIALAMVKGNYAVFRLFLGAASLNRDVVFQGEILNFDLKLLNKKFA